MSWAGSAAWSQHLGPPSMQPSLATAAAGFWDTVWIRHNCFSFLSAHPHSPATQQMHLKMTNSAPLDGFFFPSAKELLNCKALTPRNEILVKSSMLRAPLLPLDVCICITGAPRHACPPYYRLYERAEAAYASTKSQKLECSGSELTNI